MKILYSDLKILHFQSKLVDLARGTLSAPLHVRIKPTNRCNHNCYYCCYRNKNLHLNQLFDERDKIPPDRMKEIIFDLRKMGVGAVTFSGGGEPLVYPYIKGAIKDLLDSRIKVALLTNGSLLKGEVAQILSRYAAWVRISMDAADAKTYAKIRGVELGEFDKVCDNIYNFAKKKRRRCQLGVNFIVTKDNYKDIYKFLKIMKKLGVDHVKISEAVLYTDRGKNKKHYHRMLGLIKRQIKKGVSELSDSRFSIIDKVDNFVTKVDCYQKCYDRCYFVQCLTVIGADLNVYFCQDKAYTRIGTLGSLKGRSFKNLWFSKESKDRLIKLNPIKHCKHHCTQHTKNIMLLDYFGLDKKHLSFI